MSDRFDISYTAAARRALEVELPEDTSAATLEFIDEVLRDDPKSVGEPVTEEAEPEYAARVGDYWVTYRVVEEPERTDAETAELVDGVEPVPAAGRVPSDPSPIIRRPSAEVPIAPVRARTGEAPLADAETPPTKHRGADTTIVPEPRRAVDRWFEEHGSASLWVVPVMVTAAIVTGLAFPGSSPTAGESVVTGLIWDLTAYGELATSASWWQQSPLGWLQMAAWVQATGAFGRWDPAVLAVRESMIPLAAIATGLFWLLARRVGAGRVAATIAAAVFALSPAALAVHPTASIENVGAVWLVVAVLVATLRRPPIVVGAVVGVALAVAVLSAQSTLVALPVLGWVLVRSVGRRAAPAALSAAAGSFVFVAILVELILSAVASGVAPSLDREMTGLALWWQSDPALLVLAVLCAIYALRSAALRPYAALVLLWILVLALPGVLPATALAAALPFAVVVAAAVGDGAVRLLRRRSAPRRTRPLVVLAVAGAGALLVAALALLRLPSEFTAAPTDPDEQAESWLADNVPEGEPVLVDTAMRVDLLRAGWGRDDVATYDAATSEALPEQWTDAEWAVVPDRLAAAASDDSLVAADFGGLAVRRVLPGGVATATAAAEARADLRADLGAEAAANTDLVLTDADRALLAAGDVDDRIVSVLGGLAAFGSVEIAGFPTVAGEGDAPRRQVALTSAYGRPLVEGGEPTAAARTLLVGLLDQYAPASTSVAGGALVLRYPPSLGEPAD